MYRFVELYDQMLSPFRVAGPVARRLRRRIPKARLDELRQIMHHVTDRDSGRYHSAERVSETFRALHTEFKDLYRVDVGQLIADLEEIRAELRRAFPSIPDALLQRFNDLAAADSKWVGQPDLQ
jgi:hypothetical protein